MMDSIFGICLGIALIVFAIAMPVAYYNAQVSVAAIKAGLVQGVPKGTYGVYWIKPENAPVPAPVSAEKQ